jgi:hypothetical protein
MVRHSGDKYKRRSQIHVRALLGVMAHPGLANTPALEWNSYTKRNHGTQDNCVNKNKRVWNHASI